MKQDASGYGRLVPHLFLFICQCKRRQDRGFLFPPDPTQHSSVIKEMQHENDPSEPSYQYTLYTPSTFVFTGSQKLKDSQLEKEPGSLQGWMTVTRFFNLCCQLYVYMS